MANHQLRLRPRISVNKLGEYLVSTPLRRHEIIERQKYPSPLVPAHYEPARRLIVGMLCGALSREDAMTRLDSWTSTPHFESDYARHRALGCADAVLRFLALRRMLDLQGLGSAVPKTHDAMSLEGVDISVRPDVVLFGRDERGRPTIGAIKLHFPKTHPLSDTSAAYVATMLGHDLRLNAGAMGRVEPRACIVIDVFSGTVVSAPRAYRRRLREVSAACHEIRGAWASV